MRGVFKARKEERARLQEEIELLLDLGADLRAIRRDTLAKCGSSGPAARRSGHRGALTLTSASTIDLGTGASIIAFADSSGIWSGVLKILNWSGSLSGNGIDQIYFGTNTSGLTPTQLSQISFYSDATGTNFFGFGSWGPDGDGEIVPLTPIPEPTTWIGSALALASIGFTPRRRFTRRCAAL